MFSECTIAYTESNPFAFCELNMFRATEPAFLCQILSKIWSKMTIVLFYSNLGVINIESFNAKQLTYLRSNKVVRRKNR